MNFSKLVVIVVTLASGVGVSNVAHSSEVARLSILDISMGMTLQQVSDILTPRGLTAMPSSDQTLVQTGETIIGDQQYMPDFKNPNTDGSRDILSAYFSKPPTEPKLIRLDRRFQIGKSIISAEQLKAKLIADFGQPDKIQELSRAVIMTWYDGDNADYCVTKSVESVDPERCGGTMLQQNISLQQGASGLIVDGLSAKLTDVGEYRVDRKRFEQYVQDKQRAIEEIQMQKSSLPDL